MPKAPPKDYYASVMFPGSKKLSIVSKRLGSRERMFQIAVCTSEQMADRIVEALNHYQGAVATIETPLQQINEELRTLMAKVKVENDELRQKNNGLVQERERLKRDLERATRERDAAQKQARDHAAAPT